MQQWDRAMTYTSKIMISCRSLCKFVYSNRFRTMEHISISFLTKQGETAILNCKNVLCGLIHYKMNSAYVALNELFIV